MCIRAPATRLKWSKFRPGISLPSCSVKSTLELKLSLHFDLSRARPCGVQSLGQRLREQLQVLEEDLSHTSRAARAAGPIPGSLMTLVMERSKEQPAALDLWSAPLPPFEQIEGNTTPEGSGYEILLQVSMEPSTTYPFPLFARSAIP